MARKLRGAEERSHTTDDRKRDGRQVTRRVGVRGRRVLERQHGQHQGQEGDPGDDPKQRPPAARLRLQSPDERAERHGAEDAHVHDDRRVSQLVRRIADRKRRHRSDQQQARAQPLDHPTRDVHARILRRRREHRADHEQHRVADQHPALRKMLRELNSQHRAHRVRSIRQSRAQAERLHAHVQFLADDRRQRLKRRRERQVRDQREHHHRRDRGIAAGKRALTHQQQPSRP